MLDAPNDLFEAYSDLLRQDELVRLQVVIDTLRAPHDPEFYVAPSIRERMNKINRTKSYTDFDPNYDEVSEPVALENSRQKRYSSSWINVALATAGVSIAGIVTLLWYTRRMKPEALLDWLESLSTIGG